MVQVNLDRVSIEFGAIHQSSKLTFAPLSRENLLTQSAPCYQKGRGYPPLDLLEDQDQCQEEDHVLEHHRGYPQEVDDIQSLHCCQSVDQTQMTQMMAVREMGMAWGVDSEMPKMIHILG
jgi:hypothetical protein